MCRPVKFTAALHNGVSFDTIGVVYEDTPAALASRRKVEVILRSCKVCITA